MTKSTLNDWKSDHTTNSATAINSLMDREFVAFFNRTRDPYSAAAIVTKQAALLRPWEVQNPKRRDVNLPGDQLQGERLKPQHQAASHYSRIS